MSLPRVYAAITAVSAGFARHGCAKERINLADDYAYRGIDDLVVRLAPLLAEHRLCVLPRVAKRRERSRGAGSEALVHVTLQVAFDLVSAEDGSVHTVAAIGEALDASDKATAKAMTSAYKQAMVQVFCVPVAGSEDSEHDSLRIGAAAKAGKPGKAGTAPRSATIAEPVNGWGQWAEDIAAMIASCVSDEALDRLVERQRLLLGALAREQPALYRQLGATLAARREALAEGQPPLTARPAVNRPRAAKQDAALPGGEGGQERESGRGTAQPGTPATRPVRSPDKARRSHGASAPTGNGAVSATIAGTASANGGVDAHG